jgi:hypothetical protein
MDNLMFIFREGGVPARNQKGERLLLFLGIIDILQNYRLFKKLEHTWKSILHDGDSISVHNPSFYAERFQNYISHRVFIRGKLRLWLVFVILERTKRLKFYYFYIFAVHKFREMQFIDERTYRV